MTAPGSRPASILANLLITRWAWSLLLSILTVRLAWTVGTIVDTLLVVCGISRFGRRFQFLDVGQFFADDSMMMSPAVVAAVVSAVRTITVTVVAMNVAIDVAN